MKRIFILFAICCFTANFAVAQTFVFYKDGVQLQNNTKFTVSKTTLDEFGAVVIESGLSLKNLTANNVFARAQQWVESPPPSEDYGFLNFCFNVCQQGNINLWQTRTIEANALMSPPDFHLSYYPFDENYCQVRVRYTVNPESNSEDRSSVTVTYDFNTNSSSVNTINADNRISVIQDDNTLKFNYAFDAENTQLQVYDVLGNEVANRILTNQQGETTVGDLHSGIYIYTVKQNGKSLSSKKIIVK